VDPPRPAEPRVADAKGAEALAVWRLIVDALRPERPELAAVFDHAVPVTVSETELVIAVEAGGMFEKTATSKESRDALARAAANQIGAAPRIRIEPLRNDQGENTLARAQSRQREENHRAALVRAKSHPRVAEVAEILGARLKEIRLADDAAQRDLDKATAVPKLPDTAR
jgi:hypothetical protein